MAVAAGPAMNVHLSTNGLPIPTEFKFIPGPGNIHMHCSDPSPLAGVRPPEKPLPAISLLRTVVRNPIEAWPRAVYEEPIHRSVRFGRPSTFVSDPDLIREVLVDHADAFGKDEITRRSLAPALGDGILTADGPHWRWQRRAVAPIFRHDRIVSFLPVMVTAANRCLERLASLPDGSQVDLASEMMRLTFDIIVETMLSGRTAIDVERVERAIGEYLEPTSWLFAYTLIGAPKWLPYPGQRRAEAARSYLRELVETLTAHRRGNPTDRSDLVSHLLAASDPETGRSMTDREIADNVLTFITAGHETTALALTWTFYLLSRHPESEHRLLDEIDRVTGGDPIAERHLDQLGFVRQVIQESMRLYPPAPLIVRQANRPVCLAGLTIAASESVYVPIYAVHRHRTLWDSPDMFDPDRFDPEQVRGRHRYAYLPFGAGPRICIGMSFAMIEAVAILATLVRSLRITVAPGFTPHPKQRITLRPAGGMPVTIVGRR